MTKTIDRLSAAGGPTSKPQQLAEHLGCDLDAVVEALQAGRGFTGLSLDATAAGDDEPDRLADRADPLHAAA